MLGFRIADFELRIGIVLRDIGRNAGVFKNGGTSTVDTQKWTGETSVRYMLLLGNSSQNPLPVGEGRVRALIQSVFLAGIRDF